MIAPDATNQPQFTFTSLNPANLSASAISVTAANSVVDVESAAGTLGNISFNAGTNLTVMSNAVGATAVLGNLSGNAAATLNTSIPTTAGTLGGFTTFTKGGNSTLMLGDSPNFNGAIVNAPAPSWPPR